MAMKKKYLLTAASDVGTAHQTNEDSFYAGARTIGRMRTAFALIADGMGGVGGGSEASSAVRDAFESWYSNVDEASILPQNIEPYLLTTWTRLVRACNEEINRKDPPGGTTLVCCFFIGGGYYALNIGDSRLYKASEGVLVQVTEDHSYETIALARGITPDPQHKNKIVKFIGCGAERADPDFFAGPFNESDAFLLCSDGLRHHMSNSEIVLFIEHSSDDKESLNAMIDTVIARGEKDNITGITVRLI